MNERVHSVEYLAYHHKHAFIVNNHFLIYSYIICMCVCSSCLRFYLGIDWLSCLKIIHNTLVWVEYVEVT